MPNSHPRWNKEASQRNTSSLAGRPARVALPLFKGAEIGLIPRTVLKRACHHTVALRGAVNIFEDTTHPGVVTDVGVGNTCPAKGAKDINDDTVSLHIGSKMLVNQLNIRHRVGAD